MCNIFRKLFARSPAVSQVRTDWAAVKSAALQSGNAAHLGDVAQAEELAIEQITALYGRAALVHPQAEHIDLICAHALLHVPHLHSKVSQFTRPAPQATTQPQEV